MRGAGKKEGRKERKKHKRAWAKVGGRGKEIARGKKAGWRMVGDGKGRQEEGIVTVEGRERWTGILSAGVGD